MQQIDECLDNQFQRGNWFGDHATAAGQYALRAGFEVILHGHKDDRYVLVIGQFAELFAGLQTTEDRHIDVHQDQVKGIGFQQRESRRTVGHTDRLEVDPL